MVRWEPGSRGRLSQAALDLYGERGFDQTTVAEIAERAGLKPDDVVRFAPLSREQLSEIVFSGAQALQDLLVNAVLDAPASATPIEAVALALAAASDLFDEGKEFSVQRQRIIDESAELRERELIKLASLASALANALRDRGVSDPMAGLTGEVAIAIFKISFEQWVTSLDASSLSQLIHDSMDQLRALTAKK